MVACAQAHVAQARDCIVVHLYNYTIPRLRHMCLCAGNHNIGLPMIFYPKVVTINLENLQTLQGYIFTQIATFFNQILEFYYF